MPELSNSVDFHFFLNKITKPNFFFHAISIRVRCKMSYTWAQNSPWLDYHNSNSKMLKTPLDVVVITILYNKCISESHWPDVLTISKVIPLYKKGDIDNPDNFRPIAIIPVLGKGFELIMKKYLYHLWEEVSAMDSRIWLQERMFHSRCIGIKLIEDIVNDLDRSKSVLATLCDLSKAFDCLTWCSHKKIGIL